MKEQNQRAMMTGLLVALIVGMGACLPPPPGVTCGDKWCPERELCVSKRDAADSQLVCVAQGICGNGIIEGDEQCDCGDDGIVAPGASCGGQGNSDTGGLCRRDCKLHCGDGVLDADEVCDTKLPVTTTSCFDLRYDFGLPSCSESCRTTTANTCGLWNWQPMISGVSQDLNAAWGSQSKDVFAVGAGGAIIHYDGIHWQSMESMSNALFNGVWGVGSDNVYAVGDGTVEHYDGSHWQSIIRDIPHSLAGVWGSGPDDVFVVGDGGTVLHYDGAGWAGAQIASTDLSGDTLRSVWGSSSSDVFAVGADVADADASGRIYQYDGDHWKSVSFVASKPLWGVWGSGPMDVFAVGDQGTVLHYDGIEWQAMSSGTQRGLRNVWGSGPKDVFAAGEIGTVLHYDGTRWQSMNSGSGVTFKAVWGSSAGDVLVVGIIGTVLHHAGSTWQPMDPGASQGLLSVWGSGSDNIFAVGDAFLGSVDPGPSGNGGDAGSIIHYNGSRWVPMNLGVQPPLWGIWGCAPDNVFAVGGQYLDLDGRPSLHGGTVLHYDGASWTPAIVPDIAFLSSVWGSSCDDVFAVSGNGAMLRYNGREWARMVPVTMTLLTHVWGSGSDDVYAVGGLDQTYNSGIILHYDGSHWQEIALGAPLPFLVGVWGTGPDDVFVVGYGGTVLHYDGKDWHRMASGTSAALYGVWGTGADDVYVVGESGTLLHYDDRGWLPMRSDTGADFYSIWGDRSSNTLIISGIKGPLINEGVIYQMTRPRPR